MTGTCGGAWHYGALPVTACEEPGTVPYTRMCLHEHLRTGLLCPACARRRTALCADCLNLPPGLAHRCLAQVVITANQEGGPA